MRRKLTYYLLASIACLSGCAPTSNDPSQGGLMGGLQGVYGGGYDRRLQEKNEQLATHKRLHQDLEVQSVALREEYRVTDAKLVAEKQKMLALENELNSLEQQLVDQRAKSVRQQKEVESVRLRITQLQKKVQEQHNAIDNLDRAGGSTSDPARYQTLQKEREQLNQEYKALQQGQQR